MCAQVAEESWSAFLLKRCIVFEHDQQYMIPPSLTSDAALEWNGARFKVYLSMKVLQTGRSAKPHVASVEVLSGTLFGTRRIVQKRVRMMNRVETVVLKPATKCRGAVFLKASDVA
jgi:hypothetical protein